MLICDTPMYNKNSWEQGKRGVWAGPVVGGQGIRGAEILGQPGQDLVAELEFA